MISAELPPLYRTSRRRLAEGSGEHGTVAAITGKFLNKDHTSAVPSLDFGSKDHSGIIWRLAHTQNKKNRASDQDSATKQAAQRVRGLWLKGRKSWCLHFKHVYLSKLKSTVGVHRMTDSKKKPMDAAHTFHPSSSSFSFRAAIYIVLLLYRPGDGGVSVWVCVWWGCFFWHKSQSCVFPPVLSAVKEITLISNWSSKSQVATPGNLKPIYYDYNYRLPQHKSQ